MPTYPPPTSDSVSRVVKISSLRPTSSRVSVQIGCATPPDDTLPDDRRALLLLSIALRHVDERAGGLSVERALLSTIAWTGDALDPATHRALTLALQARLESAGRDAPVVVDDSTQPELPSSPPPAA